MFYYRKIQNGTLTDERRRFQHRPAGIGSADGEEWLEEVRQPAPDYDPATHRLSPLPDDIHEGIVRVERQERVALTQAELDAIAAREADEQADAQRRQQIRDVLAALDEVTGDAGQRLRRVELTLAAVIRHIIRNT
jgi:arylamine N-acetyltransferase